jgi:hypothetical protein
MFRDNFRNEQRWRSDGRRRNIDRRITLRARHPPPSKLFWSR